MKKQARDRDGLRLRQGEGFPKRGGLGLDKVPALLRWGWLRSPEGKGSAQPEGKGSA